MRAEQMREAARANLGNRRRGTGTIRELVDGSELEVHSRHAEDFSVARGGRVIRQLGHFIRHYLEMCMAMCIGFAVGDALYFWLAGQVGYSAPFRQLPELSALVVAFNMTAPMVAWMRFRRMDWRPIWEMSAAMGVWAVLLIGAGWLGIVERSNLAVVEHGLMMPVMLVPMLLRLDVYTGRSGHHAHAV